MESGQVPENWKTYFIVEFTHTPIKSLKTHSNEGFGSYSSWNLLAHKFAHKLFSAQKNSNRKVRTFFNFCIYSDKCWHWCSDFYKHGKNEKNLKSLCFLKRYHSWPIDCSSLGSQVCPIWLFCLVLCVFLPGYF